MEVSGTVFLPLPSLFGSGVEFYSDSPASLSVQIFGSRRRRVRVTNSGFSDMGHIQYYPSEPTTRGRIRCGSGKIDMKNIAKDKDKDMIKDEKKMMKKKRLKLVKSLSRDLSMYSDLGFVLDNHGLDDQFKGNIISVCRLNQYWSNITSNSFNLPYGFSYFCGIHSLFSQYRVCVFLFSF